MSMPLRFAILLVLLFALSACGLAVTPAPIIPTRVPPTPISTHLPPVATAIPAGFDSDNPIQLVFVDVSSAAASDLEEQLNALSEIEMSVISVDSQAEAMNLLCASSTGTVSAAWLNGATYPAARQCGIVSLQAERGTERDSNTGEAGVLVVSAEFAEDGLSAALAENFCRVSLSDFYGWLLPLMFFSAEGIDPTNIADVKEYPDNEALLAALASGECAAMGISESEWTSSVPEVTPEADATPDEEATPAPAPAVVATSAAFPHQIMVFPFAADLEVINEISELLLQLDMASGRSGLEIEEPEGTPEATEPSEATEAPEINVDEDTMTALFGEGYLVPVNGASFGLLDTFLESTGLNFAEIGQ